MYLHPAAVHFPLALLLCGSLIELWATSADRQARWAASARHMLLLGWWGALIATLAGIADAALRWERVQLFLGWINGHALSGLLAVAIYWRLALGRPPLAPGRRRGLLLAGVAALLLTGWLGGHLVYGLGWVEAGR